MNEPGASADQAATWICHDKATGRPGGRASCSTGTILFSNASLHSRITNAFSDIGRPRRCTLARLGAIDLTGARIPAWLPVGDLERPRPSIEDLALPDPTGENEGRG